VRDADLFRLLRRHGRALLESHFQEPGDVARTLVERAIRLMLEQLAANPYEEQSLERLADFGHTFSGRLEEVSGYRLRHGEAVAVDIALSAALAAELGMLGSPDLEDILTTLVELGLPTSSPLLTDALLQEAMHATVAHRGGSLNLVVPTGIGEAAFVRSRREVPDLALVRARRRIRTVESSWTHGFTGTRDDRAWSAGDPPTVRRSRG
jgi:2-epi-5-epi-valiolone synthase